MEKTKFIGKKIIITLLISLFFASSAFALDKVAILSFKINATENLDYLKEAIPEMIYSRLAVTSKEVLKGDSAKEAFNKGFDYVIYGSLTKLGSAISLDVRLESKEGETKTFFSSKDSDSKLIEAIEWVVAELLAGKERGVSEKKEEIKPSEDISGKFKRAKIYEFKEPIYSIALADIDGDGVKEIAFTSKNTLFIYSKNFDKLLFKEPFSLSILTINSGDFNKNLKEEIYITAIRNDDPVTICYELNNGKLQRLFEKPIYVNIFEDFSGKRLLLAQDPATNAPFDDVIYELIFDGKDFVKGKRMNFVKREELNLYQIKGIKYRGKESFLYIDEYDYFRILSSDGKVVERLKERYGGSSTIVSRGYNYQTGAKSVSLPSRVLLIKDGETDKILTLKNEGSRLFLRSKSFDRGKLVLLKFDDLSYEEIKESELIDGYLSDFTLDESESYVYISIVTDNKEGKVLVYK